MIPLFRDMKMIILTRSDISSLGSSFKKMKQVDFIGLVLSSELNLNIWLLPHVYGRAAIFAPRAI